MFKIISVLILTISFSYSTFADVIFEMDQNQVDPKATHKTKGMVKGNNFKMEFYENGEKLDGSMIYHGETKEMIMVNHNDKSYVVLDQAAHAGPVMGPHRANVDERAVRFTERP
ncbi:MAG: DUF4412 domain-containing protein, partial [Desulfobulbaceae bacterium]